MICLWLFSKTTNILMFLLLDLFDNIHISRMVYQQLSKCKFKTL